MKALTVSTLVCTIVVLASIDANALVYRRGTYCPSRWFRSGGRCFYYVSSYLTWVQAEKNCQSMGANLASVHSFKEHRRIRLLIARRTGGYRPTWLGASDCQKEGFWLWSDGTRFDFRYSGVFNNLNRRQHCLQMNFGAYKRWDDTECWRHLPSVCAKIAT
uniref:ladderlectin-like n=1 Tax=Scatophagus argus TaxID=75038 RepID=UPI001ED85BAB|nr:ladderlectin-like [Scatophagus argus]